MEEFVQILSAVSGRTLVLPLIADIYDPVVKVGELFAHITERVFYISFVSSSVGVFKLGDMLCVARVTALLEFLIVRRESLFGIDERDTVLERRLDILA